MASNGKIRVAVNGYGVIGKRIADAVRLQPDMELVGVSDVGSDYRIQTAATLDIPVYAATSDSANDMESGGITMEGEIATLIEQVYVDARLLRKWHAAW